METPEHFQGGHDDDEFTPEKRLSDHFTVEDLLNLPNDDGIVMDDGVFHDNCINYVAAAGTNYSATTGSSGVITSIQVDSSCNSSFSGSSGRKVAAGDISCPSFPDGHLPNEFGVPYDDIAELEWLSNFVEESFSNENLQKPPVMSEMKAPAADEASEIHDNFQPETGRKATPIFKHEVSVPAKVRSKRSRAAPCNWASCLLVVSPPITPENPDMTAAILTPTITTATTTTTTLSSSSESADIVSGARKKTVRMMPKMKENSNNTAATSSGGEGRRCLHCATDKTPQWRTGPMGPKTLCNACGVRYKSGRLVPEYRPAASPTFVLTKHSNSHRKVLEIRRQKEMLKVQQQ